MKKISMNVMSTNNRIPNGLFFCHFDNKLKNLKFSNISEWLQKRKTMKQRTVNFIIY